MRCWRVHTDCGGVWSVCDSRWPHRLFIPLPSSTSGHFWFQLKITKPNCIHFKPIFWPTDTTTGRPFPSTSSPVHCSLLVPSVYSYYTESRRVYSRRRRLCGSSSSCFCSSSSLQSDTASPLQNCATADGSNWGHPWF